MERMMDWMDNLQHDGRFHWSETLDSCAFVPDGSLMPDTEHMLFMPGPIRGHQGMLMDMHNFENEAYMHHFRAGH